MDSSQLKGSSDQSRDHLDSISNEDSEYHTLIIKEIQQQRKIDSLGSFLSSNGTKRDRIRPIPEMPFWIFLNVPATHGTWSELHLGSGDPAERSTRDHKLLKKQQDLSFVPSRRSEEKRNG
ncbi:hypothetical protein HAX54_038953 [Datura stramonium]|uniref:Ycf2 N-terminal domain-containing protein n=1 Tax=Datura stramonium TaxID=4076 RepID=A0ABS8VKG8_DATST|nr:hypothetical protein [Datura stramonium]